MAPLAKSVERPVRVQWSRADEHGCPKDPPTLVDIRAAVDGGVVTAWESEFLIPQQTAGGFNVPLVAATLAGMPADDHIAPGNIFQNSVIPYKFANVKTVCRRLATTPLRPSCRAEGAHGSGLIERCKKTGRVYSTARLRTVFLSCRSSVVCG